MTANKRIIEDIIISQEKLNGAVDMHSNSAIFAVSTILLVPFLYYATSIPVACALPRDPNYAGTCTSKSEPGKFIETCCWTEQGTGPGLIKLREKYCQTCTTTSEGETCDQKELQVIGKPPAPEAGGGVLQDPSTDSGPKLLQKDGMVFNLPTENKTAPSEQNSSTNNNTVAKDLREPGKIEVPNLK